MSKPLLTALALFLFMYASSQQLTAVSVNLFTYTTERQLRDGVAVFFSDKSDTIDLFDIKKLANPLENLAILRNNILLAGEQRTTYDTIPLTVWNLQPQQYELEIFLRNITDAYLEDTRNGTKHYFTSTDTLRYTFANTSTDSPLDSTIRFRLMFGKPPAVPVTDTVVCFQHQPQRHTPKINIYPNPVCNGYAHLDMEQLPEGRYQVTFVSANRDMIPYGTITHRKGFTNRINTMPLKKGIYYIVIQNGKGFKTARQLEVH
jgi:hypothetical protein